MMHGFGKPSVISISTALHKERTVSAKEYRKPFGHSPFNGQWFSRAHTSTRRVPFTFSLTEPRPAVNRMAEYM